MDGFTVKTCKIKQKNATFPYFLSKNSTPVITFFAGLPPLLMPLLTTVPALRQHLLPARQAGKTIGLVPTMGALHAGHLRLIAQAKAECDLVVCSIFVNPTQFNNPADLARYPRTLEQDTARLETVGTDVIFAPDVAQMYPQPTALRLDFGPLETVLEGASRPGHFNGVGLVVSKLFHMVQPHRAYFGQKDLQQVAVVRRLVTDLSFPLELVCCPTIREADGLAMSSRNRLLSPQERTWAPRLFAALALAQNALLAGQSAESAIAQARQYIAKQPAFTLDYLAVVDPNTLMPLPGRGAPGQTAICVAAQLGNVRLIDNVVF